MLSYTMPMMAVIAMLATVSFGVIAATAVAGMERHPVKSRRSKAGAASRRR